jgi:hypothetical protein
VYIVLRVKHETRHTHRRDMNMMWAVFGLCPGRLGVLSPRHASPKHPKIMMSVYVLYYRVVQLGIPNGQNTVTELFIVYTTVSLKHREGRQKESPMCMSWCMSTWRPSCRGCMKPSSAAAPEPLCRRCSRENALSYGVMRWAFRANAPSRHPDGLRARRGPYY